MAIAQISRSVSGCVGRGLTQPEHGAAPCRTVQVTTLIIQLYVSSVSH